MIAKRAIIVPIVPIVRNVIYGKRKKNWDVSSRRVHDLFYVATSLEDGESNWNRRTLRNDASIIARSIDDVRILKYELLIIEEVHI